MANKKWYKVVGYTIECEHCGIEHTPDVDDKGIEELADGVMLTCNQCGNQTFVKWEDFNTDYE